MPKGVGGSSAVCTGGLDATLRGRRRGGAVSNFHHPLEGKECFEKPLRVGKESPAPETPPRAATVCQSPLA